MEKQQIKEKLKEALEELNNDIEICIKNKEDYSYYRGQKDVIYWILEDLLEEN